MKITKIFIALSCLGFLGACSSLPKEGSERKYQSNISHHSERISNLNVRDFTNAPLRIVVMARLNVTTDKAFELVSKDLPVWFEKIPSVQWDHTNSENKKTFGAGSTRTCALDGDKLFENIRYWDEGKMYAYAADMSKSTVSMPIIDHLGVFIIESDGSGGSLVTWRQYYNKKFSLMGPMLTWYMRTQMMEEGFNVLVKKFGGELVSPNF